MADHKYRRVHNDDNDGITVTMSGDLDNVDGIGGMTAGPLDLHKLRRRINVILILLCIILVLFVAYLSALTYAVQWLHPYIGEVLNITDTIRSDINNISPIINKIEPTIDEIEHLVGVVAPFVEDLEPCIPLVESLCGTNIGTA